MKREATGRGGCLLAKRNELANESFSGANLQHRLASSLRFVSVSNMNSLSACKAWLNLALV